MQEAIEGQSVEGEPSPTHARLERWKQRLLDLSLRNRLLNFRETKQSIELLYRDLAALEDALAAGARFTLQPKPESFGDEEPSVQRADAGLASELEAGRLHTTLTEAELSKRLTEIARRARESLEEGGVNTLYVGLGLLRWYETDASEAPRYAPLILLPAQLTRKSASHPYELRLDGDDARLNVTLLQKLRHDHGIELDALEELPLDDAGVDVERILEELGRAVMPLARWEVERRAYVGHFSFSKLLMWRDLEEHAARLADNALVRHLLDVGREAFPGGGEIPGEAEPLDLIWPPGDVFCPLDADSSQLRAVLSADRGETFVLQGPPGTGKSQTITNLVAQTLARGRTVLFVAEKQAALNVVHTRLSQVGLGPFCLELHSNKARKKEVLEQFAAALRFTVAPPAASWDEHTAELRRLRDELNAYVHELHAIRAHTGRSVFDGLARLAARAEAPRVSLEFDPSALTPERCRELERAAAKLAQAAEVAGAGPEHPLHAFGIAEWSPELKDDLPSRLAELRQTIDEVEGACAACAGELSIAVADSREGRATLREAAALVLDSPGPEPALLAPDADIGAKLSVWRKHGERREALEASLLGARYTDALLSLDLERLGARFQRWASAFFLFAWFMLFGARRALKAVSKSGALPDNRALSGDVQSAIELRRERAAIDEALELGVRYFGARWADGRPDWTALDEVVGWARRLRALAAKQGESLLAVAAAPVEGEGRRTLQRYVEAHDRMAERTAALVERYAIDEHAAWGVGELARVRASIARWDVDAATLQSWCLLRGAMREAASMGLGALGEALLGGLPPAEVVPAFERAFTTGWVSAVVKETPALREFQGAKHEGRIAELVACDEDVLALTRAVVAERLAARTPSEGAPGAGVGEMGILQRELHKKRRLMSIRRLLDAAPNLTRRLKPCMLMSPVSVAQYLDPAGPPFDLVVFDEASQIPAHDAIGAIARGRQVVVVGDSKQLPPTSFFASGESDEAPDDDAVEELESILDECSAAGLPKLTLDWHYRSRHDSLIAFSNHHYYENRLLSFPAAEADRARLGVSFVHVEDGCYDRAKSRTNKREAERLVTDVVRRLRDPSEQRRSIGVVTFSVAQQRLIEDLLEAERRAHPEIEPYFHDGEVAERLFVKNLEGVQGDERDVILFSIGYGPDANGKVAMNFGPLNRVGGERRLNVAVTRARQQLVVFSTLLPEQIDVTRTRAVGAEHLKTFLDYARRGPQAIAEAAFAGPDGDFGSPFEAQVFEALSARGWTLHSQVGCGGYRIDLAVVDPDRPGRYLLGIECDGASYHSAKSARDRDRLRAAVLRELGWTLHRVWSTDFWIDPKAQIDRAEAAIESARRSAQRADVLVGANEAWSEEPVSYASLEQEMGALRVAERAAAPTPARIGEPYRVGACEGPPRSPDELYATAFTAELAADLRGVIEAEAPLQLALLGRRIAERWGIKRVTKRVLRRLEDVLESMPPGERPTCAGDLVWARGQSPETFDAIRVPASDDAKRSADEIPLVELANAAERVLEGSVAIDVDDLARETVALFDIARMGAKVKARMLEAIELSAERGRCRVEGERVIRV